MNDIEIIEAMKAMEQEQFKPIEKAVLGILSPCSVRLHNAIRNAGGIRGFCIDYLYSDTSNLLKIRNFGKKSLTEILPLLPSIKDTIHNILCADSNISNQHVEHNQNRDIDYIPSEPQLIIQTLSKIQLEILDRFYNDVCSAQSIRVQNVLRNIDVKNFITRFIDKKEDVKKLDRIGRKSETEIKKIVDLIQDKISDLTIELQDDKAYIIQKKLFEYKDYSDDFVIDYLNRNGNIPILYVLSNVFLKYANTTRGDIAIHLIGVLSLGKKLTRAQISEKYDYTYERVRQISKAMSRTLIDFSFKSKNQSQLLNAFQRLIRTSADWEYTINQFANNTIITEYDFNDLLKKEKSTLHNRFVLNIIRNLFKERFCALSSLDGEEDGLAIKPFYLIDRNIYDIFDFELFFKYFNDMVENSYSDIEFSIQELVYQNFSDCWKNFSPENIKAIEKILTRIFIEDYNIMPNENQKFIIEAKKSIHVSDVIYQILYDFGEPMTIQDLFNEVSVVFPNRYDKPEQLRPVILHDNRISSVGRGSAVALKEWDHVKFGSIRDIIVEYLNQFTEPKHISDITSYVIQYASTNEKNIRSTMGSGDQFVVFENGYFGLSDRTYSNEYILSEERKTFESRIAEFEKFLAIEGHFPFASSNNPEEESLNHWWKRITVDNLNSEQIKRFTAIIKKYESLPKDKRSFRWFSKCSQYINFLIKHNHKPSLRKNDEYELAEWFSKASRDFNDCKLSIEQERRFVKLCKYL